MAGIQSDSHEWKISREDMFNMPREQRIGEKLFLGQDYVYVLRVGPPLFDEFDYSPMPEPVLDFDPMPLYYATAQGDRVLTLGLPEVRLILEAQGLSAVELIQKDLRSFCVFVAAHANKGALFQGRPEHIAAAFGNQAGKMRPMLAEDLVSFWTYDDRRSPALLAHLSVSVSNWQLKTEEVLQIGK